MTSLKSILREIGKDLRKKEKIREKSHKDLRKATSLSKQTILLIHQKRLKESRETLNRAKTIIAELKNLAAAHPDIVHGGMLSAALQEYAEANIFLSLVEESRFVTPEEIDTTNVDYVLGLADVIGEYRRLALDALREGNVVEGEKCLQTMDSVYMELMGLDESYMLVSGLRRKCDVARRVIEATRGDVTQETRRDKLEQHLRRFEKQAKAKAAR